MRHVMPVILFLFTAVPVFAGTVGGTPYGDYPHWHSAYGICRDNFGPREAEIALERYFASKGLRAENMRHKDRFIVADIYRGDRLFDKVLFDRKTGRIRSIY
jgi:hypothetical protein